MKRACRKWVENILNSGIKNIRRNYINNVQRYIGPGTHNAFNENDDKNRYEDIHLLDKSRIKIRTSLDSKNLSLKNWESIMF